MNIERLLLQLEADAEPEYLFFWGHRPRADGRIGPSCMSQWFAAPFVVQGRRYATAEHFMMAEKAKLFGDEDVRREIFAAEEPADAKALGRKIKGFDEQRWAEARHSIVVAANMAKFGSDAALASYLVGTEPGVLVEASPSDRIWGIGLAADHKDARNPTKWRGLNLLGFALMEVRARLRTQAPL